jgi:tRNA pseudouridine55 synthase
MYSALKVNGKKLYELARQGKEVERKARTVQITNIEIQWIRLPEVGFTVTCSSGTYIRTLCYDIGQKLGCGGCMKSLLRSRVSRFELKDSLRLSQIEQRMAEGGIDDCLIPVDAMFEDFPAVRMKEAGDRFLYNGNPFETAKAQFSSQEEKQAAKSAQQVRVYDSAGRFTGIFHYERGAFRPVKMFL